MEPPARDEDAEPPRSPFETFRREVMADAALQADLAGPVDADVFVALAVERARERRIVLDAEDVARRVWTPRSAVHPDGADIVVEWPPEGWLPAAIGDGAASNAGGPEVEWAHFAGAALAEPYFSDSLGKARARPFNRALRTRTSLAALVTEAPGKARQPAGLIFHLSRCGSTLAAQMLAAVPAYTVLSEAAPIDDAVRLETAEPLKHQGLLAAMVAAAGRRRFAAERRLFVKLDSWHALAGPLFRRTFPGTPWVFIYRDPLEVLVSQMQRRGSHTVRGVLPAATFGLGADIADDEYCALALRRICEAALALHATGGGRLVNYADLPVAAETQMLPHFGQSPEAAERASMARAALRDAKNPAQAFALDADAKQRSASPRLRQLVEMHLTEPYRALEALRHAAATAGG